MTVYTPPPVILPPPAPAPYAGNTFTLTIILSVLFAVGFILCCLGIFLYRRYKRQKEERKIQKIQKKIAQEEAMTPSKAMINDQTTF